MGGQSHVGAVEEDRLGEVAALELDPPPELAVLDGHRSFGAQRAAGPDHRLRSADATAGVDGHAVARDAAGIDVIGDLEATGVGYPDPLVEQRCHD